MVGDAKAEEIVEAALKKHRRRIGHDIGHYCLECQRVQREMMDKIYRVRMSPSVSTAFDDYFEAVKRWGKEDNTPQRVTAAENELIIAIIEAAMGKSDG
jgi:hypothetical protein